MKFLMLFLFPLFFSFNPSNEPFSLSEKSCEKMEALSGRLCFRINGKRICVKIGGKGISDGMEFEGRAFFAAEGQGMLIKANGLQVNSFTIAEDVSIPTCNGSLNLKMGTKVMSKDGFFLLGDEVG